MSEVGSGQVAIFPTFRGFRRQVSTQVGGATNEASRGLSRGMTQAGTTSGRGFSRAFATQSRDVGQDSLKALNAAVAKSAAQLSASRLKEQDATGKVRVAEAALAEARERGGASSARAIAAEERLATAQRGLSTVQAATARSSTSLRTAQAAVADETSRAGNEATRSGLRFRLFGSNVSTAGSVGARGFNAGMTSIRTRVGGVAASIRGSFAGLGPLIAASLGTAAIGSYLKSAVAQASDLQQNIGGVEAVMKSGAKAFLGYSKTAATSVGISASEYNRLGTLIGSQLKNGGVSTDQLAGKTKSLIATGADLSAMFGGSAADAVDALSSALKGERDPIERYGVSLNQAKIDAEAASLGFKKVGGSLSTEANQAATLSLIMKQTSAAHGAFGREADTLAHKQQVLNAQWTDGKARLGTALLPAVTAVTGALSRGLAPALDIAEKGITGATKGIGSLIAGFRNGGKEADGTKSKLASFGGGVASTLAPVGAAIGSVFSQAFAAFAPILPKIIAAASDLLPTFASLVSAVSPLQIVLRALMPVLPLIASALGQVGSTIASSLATVLPQVVPLITQLSRAISGALAMALPVILPLITQLATTLAGLIPVVLGVVAQLLPLATTLISQLAPIFTQLVTAILPPVVQIFTAIVTAIAPLITTIASVLIPVIQALLPVVTAVFGALVPIISAALQIVLGVVQVVTGILTGNWSQVWTGIQNIFGGVWNAIKAIVIGALNIIKSVVVAGVGVLRAVIGAALSAISSIWSSNWANVSRILSVAWKVITSVLRSQIDGAVKLVTGLKDKVTGAVSGAGSWLSDVGKNIVAGLKNGISGAWDSVTSLVSGLTDKLPAIVKKALGIHSPSTVFLSLGRYVVQGFAKGITGTQSQVSSAMQALANKTIDAYNATGTEKKLLKAATETTAAVYSKITTSTRAISASQRQSILTAIGAESGKLQTLATQRASVATKLKAATSSLTKVLKEQSDYAKKIASAAVARADVTSSVTSDGVIQNLKDQVAQTKAFQSTLAQLRKLGLNNTAYKQYLDKGVDSLSSAQGLLAGGKSAVKTVNTLQKQLGTAASQLGKSASSGLYKAGVNAAQGIVDGLKSKQKALQVTMAGIASAMVKRIKTALGIHSPSTVFRDQVGKFIPAGVEAGIDRGKASLDRKVAALAALPQGLGQAAFDQAAVVSPSLAAQAVTAASAALPSHITLVDTEGAVIGRMKVEAQAAVDSNTRKSTSELRTGLQKTKR